MYSIGSGELLVLLGILALLCVPVAVALLVVLRRDAKRPPDGDGGGCTEPDPRA
jgi:hypothetical protein